MNALRAIPAGMLAAAAAVLGGASKLAELGARRLAPRSEASEPRHPSFFDTSEPAARPYAGGTLYDAEAVEAAETDARSDADAAADSLAESGLDLEDVSTEDLVVAADLAAELEAAELDTADPLVAADPLVTDSELGDVAGDTVVADDAIDAMVANAMADAAVTEATGADAVAGPAEPVADDTAADVPFLDEAVLGDDGEARTYESHIAELADRNVASVVREIQDLSTEELGQLFEYESAHRKRKTVLQAIERATAPGEDAART